MRASHGDAIIHLVKYLNVTRTQAITLDTDVNKSFEVYADKHFFSNWYRRTAGDDPSTSKYCTCYSMLYAC